MIISIKEIMEYSGFSAGNVVGKNIIPPPPLYCSRYKLMQTVRGAPK